MFYIFADLAQIDQEELVDIATLEAEDPSDDTTRDPQELKLRY